MIKIPAKDKIRFGVIKDKIARSISGPTSRILARVGVSANQVTLFRLFIVAPVMLFFMFQGGYLNLLIGVLIYEFAVILDYVDGDIARIKGPTELGGIFDGRADSSIRYLEIIGISVGLKNDVALGDIAGIAIGDLALVLGLLTLFGIAMSKEWKQFLDARYIKYSKTTEILIKAMREIPWILLGAIFNQLFIILILVCFRSNTYWINALLFVLRNSGEGDEWDKKEAKDDNRNEYNKKANEDNIKEDNKEAKEEQ